MASNTEKGDDHNNHNFYDTDNYKNNFRDNRLQNITETLYVEIPRKS